MNRVQLIGRLTKEPEIRFTKTGKAVAAFDIACNRGKDKNGESLNADFVPCVAWETLAERVGEQCCKGKLVYAEGRYTTRSYEDNTGNKKYRTEVVLWMCMPIQSADARNESGFSNMGQQTDEEIPF